MKILIVTKDKASKGGVANYFRLFFQKFDDPEIELEWFPIGSRARDYLKRGARRLQYGIDFANDICKLIVKLWIDKEVCLVQVNPSLIPLPILRDGIILLISYIFSKKTIVFFRGWSDAFAKKLAKQSLSKKFFTKIFGRTDCILVLAEPFAVYLEQMGIAKEKIILTRTMFDGNLVNSVRETKKDNPQQLSLLFLSRISREKGVYEIIKALGILKKRGVKLDICFVGHGANEEIIEDLISLAHTQNIQHQIEFKGFIDGIDKYNCLKAYDILLLPSYHEGCPNTVLEAMASGCFIICSTVGALSEVVKDRVNGRIVMSRNPDDLANKIEWAHNNKQLVREIGQKNIKYAFDNFESSVIIDKCKSIYGSVI